MAQYIFSPEWFYGIDIIFEMFSVVVCFLIAYYARKLYSISKENKHNYFSLIFFFIGIAFIAKIATNFTLYYDVFRVTQVGTALRFVNYQYKSRVAYFLGYFAFRFLMIAAFSSLYLLTHETRSRKLVYLIIYFVLVTTFFSHHVYYIFHITMAVLLFILAGYYYTVYRNRGVSSSRVVAYAFGILLLSQIFFLLMAFGLEMYAVGEFVQLAGFSLLLYNFLTVTR